MIRTRVGIRQKPIRLQADSKEHTLAINPVVIALVINVLIQSTLVVKVTRIGAREQVLYVVLLRLGVVLSAVAKVTHAVCARPHSQPDH